MRNPRTWASSEHTTVACCRVVALGCEFTNAPIPTMLVLGIPSPLLGSCPSSTTDAGTISGKVSSTP